MAKLNGLFISLLESFSVDSQPAVNRLEPTPPAGLSATDQPVKPENISLLYGKILLDRKGENRLDLSSIITTPTRY
ncbi:hypothetical protein GCM10028803_48050 [Larkinella knui]|uniref:Uncharacterized protein n=1 Tax=Larkinella knui TaxID=2025310 RepID=A0A3P1CPZ1_9BACT|nr:hypothetical protein [Larkinella knui]RRB15383.1 hypothetical protein EHT87_12685 [Larkinella knui]